MPKDTDYNGCLAAIRNLPINQRPEVYGLHDNADIAKDNQESMQLLSGVLLTQTQINIGGMESDAETIVFDLANEIISRMPEQFNIDAVSEMYPVVYMNSMNTVLRQELMRFNRLTEIIKGSLENVQKAIKGQIVMSPLLEEVFYNMSIGHLPNVWSQKSYPSLKPLGSYINDLLKRINFFQNWIDDNSPIVYWISGFFFYTIIFNWSYAKLCKIK